MKVVIRTEKLTKEFKKKIKTGHRLRDFLFPRYIHFRAVDNVSLDIFEDETFGIVGPNGAGKSTLFNLLTGFLAPSEGKVSMFGKEFSDEDYQKIGILRSYPGVYRRLTGYDNLIYFSRLYNIAKPEKKIQELAEFMGIEGWLDEYVERYSSGMVNRLDTVRVLLHDPEFLFLDEPWTNLDIKIGAEVNKKLKELKKTILLATHDLDLVEKTCDRAAIMHKGKILKMGTISGLKGLIKKRVAYNVWIANLGFSLLEKIKRTLKPLELKLEAAVGFSGNKIRIKLQRRADLNKLLELLKNQEVIKLEEEKPSLAKVLIDLTKNHKL